MIDWFANFNFAPENTPVLLWFEGAEVPVTGQVLFSGGAYTVTSAHARGVVFTHWAKINRPRKAVVRPGQQGAVYPDRRRMGRRSKA